MLTGIVTPWVAIMQDLAARKAPIGRAALARGPQPRYSLRPNNNSYRPKAEPLLPDEVEDNGMQNSLSWIEWLDRLDRVLKGARQDVKALTRSSGPHAVAAIERCKRQLSALTNDLRLLDRSVLAPRPSSANLDRADNLQKALDTSVFHLDTVAQHSRAAPSPPLTNLAARERMLAAVDSALRDSSYEAAMLLYPDRGARAHGESSA
jgi:hypothetical protein